MSTYLGIPRPSAFIFQFKRASFGGNRHGNRQNFGIPRIRRFRTFLGGDFERFPRDCIETIDKMASDSEKKCCHGPNYGFAHHILIKIHSKLISFTRNRRKSGFRENSIIIPIGIPIAPVLVNKRFPRLATEGT